MRREEKLSGPDKRPTRPKGGYGTAILACLGLAIIGIWVNLTGYSPVFFPLEDSGFTRDLFRYLYVIGRIIVAVSFIIFYRFYEHALRSLAFCIPFAMCIGTGLLGMAGYQTLFPPFVAGSLGALIAGFSYLWVVATLYIILARAYPMRIAIVIIALAQILEQLVSLVLNYIFADSIQILVCLILPLLMIPLIVLGMKFSPSYKPEVVLTGPAERHQLVLIAASSAAVVIINAASSIGIWGAPRADYLFESLGVSFASIMFSCVVLGLLALCTLVCGRRMNP